MLKNKVDIKKVDLTNSSQRQEYSDKLKAFESEFSYPLGEKSFQIKHGFTSNQDIDYFSFFEQLGQVNYFVAEKNNKVVGAGCSVLREDNQGHKYWYFCDFKITQENRGQKILEKMMAKYFLQHIVKTARFVAVNMTEDEKEYNGLVKKIKQMFWFSKVQVDFFHLHQWQHNKDKLQEASELDNLIDNQNSLSLYTNIDKKDIVIDNQAMPLYHLVKKNTSLDKFKKVSNEQLPQDATVMYSVLAKEDKLNPKSISGKILLIRGGIDKDNISTLEI
jgi:hypothetical protein